MKTTRSKSTRPREFDDAAAAHRAALNLIEDAVLAREAAERVNAELRDSERRFRAMIDALPAAVYATDAESRLTHFNPAALELSACPPQVGSNEWLARWKMFRADGSPLPHEECSLSMALREGRDLEGEQIIIERPDGTRRWLEPYTTMLRDANDKVIGSLNLLVDVTEHKRGEAALRDSEARYRTLFDLGPVAVSSCDAAGVLQKFNRRATELWGREPEAGEERFCGSFRMYHPDGSFMPHSECPMADVVSGRLEEVRDGEVHIERPDGSRITVVMNIRPLKNEQGEVTGAVNCFYDITERKRAEELLRESALKLSDSDRRKSEFLAMLAHELRNPLAPISHGLQIMQLKDVDEGTVKSVTQLMERQVSHLVGLVNDLLDVNRISRGKIALNLGRIDLGSAVAEAVDIARPLFERMEQDFSVTMPREPVFLNADPLRLSQVIGNLLNNASKFSEKGGRIQLSVEREGSQALIRVRDNGIGIAAHHLPRIFELFMQADVSIERSVSGLGIGLALVRTLVEMHEGTVEAHSDGVGQGSEFVVRLPMAVDVSIPLPAPQPVEVQAAPKAHRILVVDDNRDVADSLAILLRMTGNDTYTAHDGLAALIKAEEVRPDLVLLDIGLPKLNGFEVARRIREQPWGKKMKLVALTGWGQDEDRQKSRAAGFDDHLVKPVSPDALVSMLVEIPSGASPR